MSHFEVTAKLPSFAKMHMENCGMLPGLSPAFAIHSTQMVCARYFIPHFVITVKHGYSLSGHLSQHTLPSPFLPPPNPRAK